MTFSPRLSRWFLAAISAVVVASGATAATSAEQAEQLRIIGIMAEKMRERIDELPVLLAADHPVGEANETSVTLNRDAIVVEGQRFDGVVVTAPATKASFAWAFALPPNVASWYILREGGEMKGFANFVSRPRTALASAQALKPEGVTSITLQKLDSASWTANERYVLWFRFKDANPAELTLRAGFFAAPALNNNRLPALLFPAAE